MILVIPNIATLFNGFRLAALLIAVASWFVSAETNAQASSTLKAHVTDTALFNHTFQEFNRTYYNADSSRIYLNELRKLAFKINQDEYLKSSLGALVSYYNYHTNNIDTVLAACDGFFKTMQKRDNTLGMAAAYKYKGFVFMKYSLDSAMHYNIKCLELYRKLDDRPGVSGVMINIAAIYIHMERYREAIDATRESFHYNDSIGNLGRAGTCAVNLSECYRKLGQYDSSLFYNTKSLHYNTLRKDRYGIAYAHSVFGNIYELMKEFRKAELHYRIAIKLGESTGFSEIYFMAHGGLAQMEFYKGAYDQALAHNKLSEVNCAGSNEGLAGVYKRYFDIYHAMGEYKRALEYHVSYVALRDSFQSHERLKSVSSLETQYKTREKQAQLELLQKENAYNAAIADKQVLIRNGLLAFLAFGLGGAVLMFNRFRLKKQLESQQALLDERKRISTELHDDLGAQLSTAKMFISNLKQHATAPETVQLIDNSLNLLDGSISDLRKIMDDLQVSVLQEQGYLAATQKLVHTINQAGRISFTLIQHNFSVRPAANIEHHLFRITQELVNNTVKYAGADKVSIELVRRDGKLILMYEDNGIGFDPVIVNRGYGLSNIESRVKAVQGTLQMDTHPGSGLTVVIEIPEDLVT